MTADGESYNVRSTVIADGRRTAPPSYETNEEYASLEQNPSLSNFSIGALRPLKKSVPHLCMSLSRPPPPSLSPLLHPQTLSPLQQRGRCQPRQSRFDTISSKTHSPPPSLSSVAVRGALSHLLSAVLLSSDSFAVNPINNAFISRRAHNGPRKGEDECPGRQAKGPRFGLQIPKLSQLLP